jgi:acyl carrier protein
VAIGRPIANTRLYVLDEEQQMQPVGVAGELYVSGISLAQGYLGQEEMTREKFVANPLRGEGRGHERMYRTGDLVRYRGDGNIEFLGRVDQQVKVRGFRIELGEIETALESQAGIREAVVIAREEEGGEKRLVAFVVVEGEGELDVSEMRNQLRQTLPEYMIPAAYVKVEEMPLSPSGKVDRKALGQVAVTERPSLKSEYVGARDEIEERLVEMCGELLHVEQVGVFDNFFELGGHSLLATQFVSRIRETFQVELPLRKLFETPTVSGIAGFIKQTGIYQDQQVLGGSVSSVNDASLEKQLKPERAKLAEMLKKVGGLSDEEVKAFLAEKKSAKQVKSTTDAT